MAISDRRAKAGRVQLFIEPRDAWVGVYVAPDAVYVCPLPFVVVKLRRTAPARKIESRAPMAGDQITAVIEGILDDWIGDAEPATRHREIAEALTESWLKDRRRAVAQGATNTGS